MRRRSPGGWRAPMLALALLWCVSRALVLFPGETLRDRTLYRLTILRDPGDVIIVRSVATNNGCHISLRVTALSVYVVFGSTYMLCTRTF